MNLSLFTTYISSKRIDISFFEQVSSLEFDQAREELLAMFKGEPINT